MACFLVPLGEAVVGSVIKHTLFRENSKDTVEAAKSKSAWKARISALEQMLYAGCAVLAVEHVYHGEVIFTPPFLTAMKSPEETQVMLHEMATVGSSMAAVVTAVWGAFCFYAWKKSQNNEIKKPGKAKLALRFALGTALMFGVDFLFAAFA